MISPVWFSSHQRTGSTWTPKFASSRIKASIKVCDPPWARKNGSECEKRTFIVVAQKYLRGSSLVSITPVGKPFGYLSWQQPQGEAADRRWQRAAAAHPGADLDGDQRFFGRAGNGLGDQPPFGLVQLSFNCHGGSNRGSRLLFGF